jgi:hypothetical protein
MNSVAAILVVLVVGIGVGGCERQKPPPALVEAPILSRQVEISQSAAEAPHLGFWGWLADQGVPVGMVGYAPDERSVAPIGLAMKGSLREVLDAFVALHPDYTWRLSSSGRVVIELKNRELNPACGEVIAEFEVVDVSMFAAAQALAEKSTHRLAPPTYSEEARNLEATVSYRAEGRTVCEIADDLAEKLSPPGSWAISRRGDAQFYLKLKALPVPAAEPQ